MITFLTVWTLLVFNISYTGTPSAQFTFATQKVCEQQAKRYNDTNTWRARCQFQQLPIVIPKGKQ